MDGILPARTNSGIAPYKKNISLVAWMSVKKPVARYFPYKDERIDCDKTIIYVGFAVKPLCVIMNREHSIYVRLKETVLKTTLVLDPS